MGPALLVLSLPKGCRGCFNAVIFSPTFHVGSFYDIRNTIYDIRNTIYPIRNSSP